MAAVSVDVPGLLDAWEKAEYGILPFLFEPDGGDVLAAMDRVAPVGWAVMKRHAEECWDPAPGDVFARVEGPDYSPSGVVFTLCMASSPEAFADWLSEFADALTTAGLVGRVRRQPQGPDVPRWYNHITTGQYTAFVYYDVIDPLLYAATPGQWNVSGEVTARIAKAIADWQLPSATRLLMSVGGSSELPPDGADVIEAALHGTRGLCHVDSFIADPPRLRMVKCGPSGQAAWMVGDSRLKWRERLATAVEALTALPDCTRFGFVQPATKNDTSDWGDLFRNGHYRIGHEYYGLRLVDAARIFDDFIPDARGAMLLTDRHLAKTTDLSEWTVTDVGAGRHLVVTTNVEGWFGSEEPSLAVLESARRDFAALLPDHDLVEQEAQRARSIQDTSEPPWTPEG